MDVKFNNDNTFFVYLLIRTHIFVEKCRTAQNYEKLAKHAVHWTITLPSTSWTYWTQTAHLTSSNRDRMANHTTGQRSDCKYAVIVVYFGREWPLALSSSSSSSLSSYADNSSKQAVMMFSCRSIAINLRADASFIRNNGNGSISRVTAYFHTRPQVITDGQPFDINNILTDLNCQVENWSSCGLGFTTERVLRAVLSIVMSGHSMETNTSPHQNSLPTNVVS